MPMAPIDLCCVCVDHMRSINTTSYAPGGIRYQPAGKPAYSIVRLEPEILEAIDNGGRFTAMNNDHLPMRAVTTVRGTRYCEIHVPALPNGYAERQARSGRMQF